MRNSQSPFTLLVMVLICLLVSACGEQTSSIKETDKAFHVVKGTNLTIELQSPLSSNSNLAGDTFQLTLKAPLMHGELVVLPKDTLIKSSIKSVKKYEKFGDKASLGFSFDQLILPNRKVISLQASLDQTKGKSPIKVKGQAKQEANAVLGTAVMGALMEDASQASTTQTMSDSGLLLGAMIGTGSVLLSKAKEVSLPIGTEMTISLGEELTIPKDR